MSLRLALVSMHTSPLDPPGVGDAGGLNVYVRETAAVLNRAGVSVTVFTRARSASESGVVLAPDGVRVEALPAGPLDTVAKEELPALVPEFAHGLASRLHDFDVVHSHYWLSGLAVETAGERLPHVHTMHTMARVKNSALAPGQPPEPQMRLRAEASLARSVHRLTANTHAERDSLVDEYLVSGDRVDVVPPGVDLDLFSPGDRQAAKGSLGLAPDRTHLLFVGRIQPLKGPDVLIEAAEQLRSGRHGRRDLEVVICGDLGSWGPTLRAQATRVKVPVRFIPAQEREQLVQWYRAATVTAMPSASESFGIVALESQASGTPVLVTNVGGLRTSAPDGVGGLAVPGREPSVWARSLHRLLDTPDLYERLRSGALAYASQFTWESSVGGLLDSYDRARLAAVALPT